MTELRATGDNVHEVKVKVAECLSKLPQTSPDAVAEYMKKSDIKGKMFDINSCPVAKYIHKCSGYSNLQVSANQVSFCTNKPCSNPACNEPDCGCFLDIDFHGVAEMSGTVTEFIRKFDYGQYPDLIEGS